MNHKISQKILKVLKNVNISEDIVLLKDMNVEIVADVVYVEGYPVPFHLQKFIYDWLIINMSNRAIFKEDFRRFN